MPLLHGLSETTLRIAKDSRIGIIGLGYVGLPLAVEFGKHYPDGRVRHQDGPHRRARARQGLDARDDDRGARERRSSSRSRPTRATLARVQYVHRYGADAGRQEQPASADAAQGRERDRRQRAEEGRRRRLRVDGVPGLHRGILRADPRSSTRGSSSTRTSSAATAPSASIPATSSIGCRRSRRSLRGRRRRSRTMSTRSTAASSRPARTRRRASRSPKPRRSSRTRSATSTSR